MTSNVHLAWAELLLHALSGSGVRDVVISPGSRSTPLALALARSSTLRSHVVIDERQAGFFALGQVRASGHPAVLICTSGSAAGHYLPSLLEAREAQLPVVVLSADRPWEAQHAAASQTTDQSKLFGDVVRAYFALGLPEPSREAFAAVLRLGAQAVHAAVHPSGAPVHLNAPWRKPLEPVDATTPEPWQPLFDELSRRGPTRALTTQSTLTVDARAELAALIGQTKRPLFVAGPWLGPGDRDTHARTHVALYKSLAQSGGVLLAESTSALKHGPNADFALRHGEALAGALPESLAPDLIIELGLPAVGPKVRAMAGDPRRRRVVVAPSGWSDPSSSAHALLPLELAHGLDELGLALPSNTDTSWRDALRALDDRLETALLETVLADDVASEASIARDLTDTLPAKATLLVGNSLPVRDLDTFGSLRSEPLCILHQRGVAGIDGLLAGVAGAATVSRGPVALYLGDVSFLHDVGALDLLARAKTPVVVVVVDNGGGRIFQELPLGRRQELDAEVDRFFVTPHGRRPAELARAFGLAAESVDDRASFRAALTTACAAPHATVIEVVVAPDQGRRLRAAWRARATDEIATRAGA